MRVLSTLALILSFALFGDCGEHSKAPPRPSLINARELVRPFEVQPLREVPNWAIVEEPPLFTFAWLSDLHMTKASMERTRRAFEYIDVELRPFFVVFTGDNNAYAPAEASAASTHTRPYRLHKFFRRFLEEHLKSPAVVLPGDNWGQDFEKVFGPFQFGFDVGGMHFLFASLDYEARGVEGAGGFDESTWAWIQEDLTRNLDRPTIFMMHETILPPSFPEAVRLRRLLDASPNVIAACTGHLHLDLEFDLDRVKYFVGPAVGPHPRHGFKHALVYRNRVVLRTIEYEADRARYAPTMKFQKIDIPEPLRNALRKPSGAFRKERYAFVADHPRRHDPELRRRQSETATALTRFGVELAWRKLGKAAPFPKTPE